MNDLIDFEASEGGVDDGGYADAGDEVVAGTEAVEEPAGPWSPSQDEWNQVTQFMGQAAPILDLLAQQYQQGYQQQGYDPYQQQGYQQGYEEPQEFDPFDPQSVQQYIQQGIQQGIQQTLTPYEGLLGMVASQQGESLARSELDTIREEIGDFNEDAAFLVASGLIEQGGDPGAALRQSAQFAREWEAEIRANEREKYKAELQNLQGAPRETPVGGASAAHEEGVPTGQGRYEEAIRRALANRHPISPVG